MKVVHHLPLIGKLISLKVLFRSATAELGDVNRRRRRQRRILRSETAAFVAAVTNFTPNGFFRLRTVDADGSGVQSRTKHNQPLSGETQPSKAAPLSQHRPRTNLSVRIYLFRICNCDENTKLESHFPPTTLRPILQMRK